MPTNYEKAVERTRVLFLTHNPARIAYPVDYDGATLSLRFVDQWYRINCADGSVTSPPVPITLVIRPVTIRS